MNPSVDQLNQLNQPIDPPINNHANQAIIENTS